MTKPTVGECPVCGHQMYWDDQDNEWACQCGEVFTDDELEEAKRER